VVKSSIRNFHNLYLEMLFKREDCKMNGVRRHLIIGSLIVILLTTGVGLLACGARPAAITSDCTRTCPLEPYATTADNVLINQGKQLSATVGQKFTITLESNQTTGYQWQLAKPLDESIVKLVGSEYEAPKSGLVGQGGREVWTFEAVSQGITQIAMKYARPWESTPPAQEQLFSVTVK